MLPQLCCPGSRRPHCSVCWHFKAVIDWVKHSCWTSCSAGFYVEPLSQRCDCSGCAVDRAVLLVGSLPRCGALQVEATKGSLLSPVPRAVLVLPDAATVAELRQLEPAIRAGALLARVCDFEDISSAPMSTINPR